MAVHKTDEGLYEVEVDGKKYQFEKWGAEESLDVLLELVPIIGGPLGAAVSIMMKKDDDDKGLLDREMPENVGQIIVDSLTKNFNKSVVKTLLKKFCSGDKVLCEGAKFSFGTHYEDNLAHMFKVVAAGAEVQYGNFFGAVLGATGLKVKVGRQFPANRG